MFYPGLTHNSQTKIQVRSEDRYHGFVRTVATIWQVRVCNLVRSGRCPKDLSSNAVYRAISMALLCVSPGRSSARQ